MTAFMIKPYHDRVEILTDGATYTPDGVLLSTSYKVHRCEFLPLAIVGSGKVSAIDSIAAMILQAVEVTCSIDDCLAVLAGSLQKIAPTACGEFGSKTEHVRIGIAAISETSGPLCLYFNSFDDADTKAFTLISMRISWLISPILRARHIRLNMTGLGCLSRCVGRSQLTPLSQTVRLLTMSEVTLISLS